MYWPGGYSTWYEAHNSFGVTSTGVAWGLAEGRFGFAQKFETYILLTNPTNTPTACASRSCGRGIGRRLSMTARCSPRTPGQRRHEQAAECADYDPAGERFGTIVESLDNVGIAVERAMYFTTNPAQFWNDGTNATAVQIR